MNNKDTLKVKLKSDIENLNLIHTFNTYSKNIHKKFPILSSTLKKNLANNFQSTINTHDEENSNIFKYNFNTRSTNCFLKRELSKGDFCLHLTFKFSTFLKFSCNMYNVDNQNNNKTNNKHDYYEISGYNNYLRKNKLSTQSNLGILKFYTKLLHF